MLTHDQIWKAIDRLADAHGYSTSGLAKRAGLDPTTFNRSKRFSNDGKERWPSTESVAKVLAVTGATPSAFIALMNDDDPHDGSKTRYIPVLPLNEAGKNGHFDAKGIPTGRGWDDIQFPGIASGNVYALEITGDDALPTYRAGDRLVVAPHEPVRRGDRVVVGTTKGDVQAGVLIRQTATRLDLTPFGGGKDREWAANEVAWVARIIWASQ